MQNRRLIHRLIQGQVSDKQFQCLLRFTKFTSDRKIDALRAYLVLGHSKSMAYTANDLKDSKFDEALAVINEKWTIHQELIDATNESRAK
ncbi:PapB/FocB family fimbrial expression transcriptional regulator [Shewanella khirikhana]|uniref:Adhesin biosynthesis transcription regulatory protein n=1 Tax=Shewanella khirikhana TaxID=1965282 RepID=A0ABM7DXQ5_9GAMM|nr:PapB/FocB family fimbrial expression transcriptional regulator [Shewanella khirikhana]AZQ13294.1 Adhesin biosynthesis transcription regulatory protein [Shewanella khirikhana]